MKKLALKDIVFTGIYSALYLVCVAIGALLSIVITHQPNMLSAPAFAALIGGSIYMLLVQKVHRYGAISLVGMVMAIFFFLSGHFVLSFVPSFVCGLLADVIAKSGNYQHRWTNLVSYIVFSFGNLGPIILMWFARDAYITQLLNKKKDMTYINNVLVDFTSENVMMLIVMIVVTAIIGGLFGQYIIQKYIKKSGVL